MAKIGSTWASESWVNGQIWASGAWKTGAWVSGYVWESDSWTGWKRYVWGTVGWGEGGWLDGTWNDIIPVTTSISGWGGSRSHVKKTPIKQIRDDQDLMDILQMLAPTGVLN